MKGLAWLKACKNVRDFLEVETNGGQKPTIGQLDRVLEREYMREVKKYALNESKEDELRDIKESISDLKNQNELLKMDVVYLKAKKRNIDQKRFTRSKSCRSLNKTFDVHRVDDSMLNASRDENPLNQSELYNSSGVDFDRAFQAAQSLEDNDFTAVFDEIKEEDEESSETEFNHFKKSSRPMRFESLTNDSNYQNSSRLK